MSKQSEAKEIQHYTSKAPNCGDCAHITSDMVMPAWMIESGIKGDFSIEKNIRCSLGGFAVKKMAICSHHTTKEVA